MPKIAMLGLGGMGRHHAHVLTKKLGHTLFAVSDEFPEARDRFKAEYPGTLVFENHKDLLEKARPDVAWVCLPTFLHHPVALDCAAAGVHVMLEKPMALKSDECRAIDTAAKKAKIKLMLAFCRRFDAHWGTLRKILAEDSVLGRPVVWRQMFAGSGPGRWFMDQNLGGGPFIDGCVHNHDFNLWTFGKAVSVKSSLVRLAPTSAWDTGVADIVFERGDRTSLNWSWGLPKGSRGINTQDVLGAKGALHFGIPEAHRPADFDPQTQDGFHVIGQDGAVSVHTFHKNDMYEEEDRHFLECVERDREPSVGAAEGLAATELAERIFADAERTGS
ncbi:MAG: Gfo/Idh/MocA family oxidoreductase [Planctomycetes bacterium]|nr:Gfo/Idh/MocA family oxidoreductase [Planctomycetota bacterium]